jgi:hypothetical protein
MPERAERSTDARLRMLREGPRIPQGGAREPILPADRRYRARRITASHR